MSVLNFDAAREAINAMQPFQTALCSFEVRDMLATGLPDCCMDVCLDKGGLDVLTHLHRDGGRGEAVAQYCQEMGRMLRQGGMLLQITEEPPEVRLEELGNCGAAFWKARLAAVLEAEEWAEPYYVYSAVKQG
eukprot:GGOE01018953.1.p1 GENE.GGOE01018953.1~~GGOE01018953.1.p1  ORF type:complete len:133 (-),score=27.10 GGOE01018953.1:300-698(-)